MIDDESKPLKEPKPAFELSSGELRQIIEVREQLEAEKSQVVDQIKAHMAEAKARGYDLKALNQVLARRKRHQDDINEEQAVLDTYLAAMGME
ncbi:DUF2312 domain-containing protein [Paracoccus litorisediminis]|uniref:DUF2312 domain-containing protein n=1 Tax=Paracoccus litorisediminis TaxID=2006130 RepID=A0A844HQL5_9RHOB|nr:DUF2312 domain-containing protein [Paracoccus litorisediminis]MTH62136.1 DUF2312 domain-containing protein [Paracoccus litorisediminis]